MPHEGHACLRERTQPVVHHEFVVEGDGRGRHRRGTEAVDGRLQAHVAEREYDATKPRRDAYAQYAAQEEGRHTQLPEFQLEGADLVQQEVEQGDSADDVRDDRRNRNARYTHAKARYKNQVQCHIDGSRHHENVKGPFCIALAAQDGGDEVVNHHEGHAGKVDLQVKHRHVQHVRRCRDQFEDRLREKDAHEREEYPAEERHHHRRVDAAGHGTVTALADGIGHHHVRAYGNPDEQVDEHVDDERVRTHGREGFVARELPHYGDIREVEHLLENAAQGNRDGEPQDLSPEGPVQHIYVRLCRRHAVP